MNSYQLLPCFCITHRKSPITYSMLLSFVLTKTSVKEQRFFYKQSNSLGGISRFTFGNSEYGDINFLPGFRFPT